MKEQEQGDQGQSPGHRFWFWWHLYLIDEEQKLVIKNKKKKLVKIFSLSIFFVF